MENKTTIYLGLGTNVGNREENLTRAIEKLSLALGKCIALSSYHETEPWGFSSDNSFLNCAAMFMTDKTPIEVLNITESVEKALGRTVKSSNGIYHDRIIDIDILLYGGQIIKNERLTVPHPLMHERLFVLAPLAEIAPKAIHPGYRKNIAQLLKEQKEKE